MNTLTHIFIHRDTLTYPHTHSQRYTHIPTHSYTEIHTYRHPIVVQKVLRFYPYVNVSELMYRCTTRMLTKRMEKKLNGKYTWMLSAILNKIIK